MLFMSNHFHHVSDQFWLCSDILSGHYCSLSEALHVDHVRLRGMEGEKNASLVTQEMGNSDEEADDHLWHQNKT